MLFVVTKLPFSVTKKTFLLRSNTYKIQKTLPNYHVFIKPAVPGNHDQERAKNGMFVAVPDSVKNQVQDISPEFYRVQVVKVNLKNSSCVIVNSYLPCKPTSPRAGGGS